MYVNDSDWHQLLNRIARLETVNRGALDKLARAEQAQREDAAKPKTDDGGKK